MASSSAPASSTPTGIVIVPGPSPSGGIQQAPNSSPASPNPTSPQPSTAPGGVPPGTAPGGAPGNAPGGAHGGAPGGAPGAGAHGAPDMKHVNPYNYTPSFSMAIVGSCAFLISGGFHTFQMFKYKAWYMNLVMQAVLMSAAAMIARTHSVMTLKETGATGPFVVFTMMDMIGPTLLVIGNIFTVTRVIWWVTPNERRTFQTLKSPPKHISFLWAGLFSIADIAKAVGQNAFKHTDPTGLKIQEIGQVLQVFVLLGHFMFTFRFMLHSRRWLIHGAAEDKNWRSLGWTATIIAGLLAFRHLFTVVAFDARADRKSFFGLHEWMYWATETIPLFICYALYNMNHPGEYFPREYTGFRLKLKEIEKAKLEQPWPLTISSPIRNDRDDKGVEISLTELENGREVRNHRR